MLKRFFGIILLSASVFSYANEMNNYEFSIQNRDENSLVLEHLNEEDDFSFSHSTNKSKCKGKRACGVKNCKKCSASLPSTTGAPGPTGPTGPSGLQGLQGL